MRGSRKSLGKELEEILTIKTKAERNVKICREDLINISTRTAESVIKQLDKLLTEITNAEDKEQKVEIAEDIYNVLLETDFRKLEKTKAEYDDWKDLNDKFNS